MMRTILIFCYLTCLSHSYEVRWSYLPDADPWRRIWYTILGRNRRYNPCRSNPQLLPPLRKLDHQMLDSMLTKVMHSGGRSKRFLPITPVANELLNHFQKAKNNKNTTNKTKVDVGSVELFTLKYGSYICMATHVLPFRLPKDKFIRQRFVGVINSYIKYLNHHRKHIRRIAPFRPKRPFFY